MSELTCPYCEKEQQDTFELGEDGTTECGDCGKWFLFSSYVTRHFNAKKCPCLNDEAAHEWKDFGSYRVCRTCDKRERTSK